MEWLRENDDTHTHESNLKNKDFVLNSIKVLGKSCSRAKAFADILKWSLEISINIKETLADVSFETHASDQRKRCQESVFKYSHFR